MKKQRQDDYPHDDKFVAGGGGGRGEGGNISSMVANKSVNFNLGNDEVKGGGNAAGTGFFAPAFTTTSHSSSSSGYASGRELSNREIIWRRAARLMNAGEDDLDGADVRLDAVSYGMFLMHDEFRQYADVDVWEGLTVVSPSKVSAPRDHLAASGKMGGGGGAGAVGGGAKPALAASVKMRRSSVIRPPTELALPLFKTGNN